MTLKGNVPEFPSQKVLTNYKVSGWRETGTLWLAYSCQLFFWNSVCAALMTFQIILMLNIFQIYFSSPKWFCYIQAQVHWIVEYTKGVRSWDNDSVDMLAAREQETEFRSLTPMEKPGLFVCLFFRLFFFFSTLVRRKQRDQRFNSQPV